LLKEYKIDGARALPNRDRRFSLSIEPTRKELARIALMAVFGAAGLVIG